MPLKHALVDRARAVYEVEDPDQPWTEGEPWAEQKRGPWFPCRLNVKQPTEGTGVPGVRGMAARGYHRMEATADLIVGTTYSDGSSLTDGPPGVGNFIAFDDGMLLEVISSSSPDKVWHVAAGVGPIRKLRKMIGWTTQLRRAREPRVTLGALAAEGTAPSEPPLVGVVGQRPRRTVKGGEPGL